MLTIKDKSDIGAVINWAYKWCSCPFTWDGEKGIFRYTNSPSKEIGLFYNALYWWGYLAFLSSALIQDAHARTFDFSHTLRFIILAVGIPIGIAYLAAILNGRDLVVTLNSSIKLGHDIHREYGQNREKIRDDNIVIFIRFTIRILVFVYVALAAVRAWYKPYDPIFISSLIPCNYRNPGFAIFQAIFTARVMLSVSSVLISMGVSIFIFPVIYFTVQDQLNLRKKEFWTDHGIRTIPVLKRGHSGLTILMGLFNSTFSQWVIPLQTALTRATHICNVFLIRHSSSLPTPYLILVGSASMIFVVSWLVMVFCAGKLHLSSVKIITSWKRWPSPLRASIWRKKIWKKELKAIRPLA
ncbi:hypothetical protein Fcan01_18056, partial [Folsomia candida]